MGETEVAKALDLADHADHGIIFVTHVLDLDRNRFRRPHNPLGPGTSRYFTTEGVNDA